MVASLPMPILEKQNKGAKAFILKRIFLKNGPFPLPYESHFDEVGIYNFTMAYFSGYPFWGPLLSLRLS